MARRRGGGSKGPSKKQLAQQRAASMTDNEEAELVGEFQRRLGVTMRSLEEASGKHRAEVKAAQAAGLNTKVMLTALKAKRRDPDEVAAENKQYIRYCKWMGMPIGAQATLFPDPDGEILSAQQLHEQAVWDAEQGGYAAGKKGHDRLNSNPHPAGMELHVAWDTNWSKGQEAAAAELPEGVTAKRGKKGRANPEDAAVKEAEH